MHVIDHLERDIHGVLHHIVAGADAGGDAVAPFDGLALPVHPNGVTVQPSKVWVAGNDGERAGCERTCATADC